MAEARGPRRAYCTGELLLTVAVYEVTMQNTVYNVCVTENNCHGNTVTVSV